MKANSTYSEAICGNVCAILKDGVIMPVEQIVAELNGLSERVRCLEQALDASIARKSIIGPL